MSVKSFQLYNRSPQTDLRSHVLKLSYADSKLGDKKLSCRRETARCFVSLNVSLSHSRSLKVIETGTIRKLGYAFLFAFHCNYGSILYHFRDKAGCWSKIAIFAFDTPVRGFAVGILPHRLVWKKFEDTFSRFNRIPACDGQTDILSYTIQQRTA